MAEVEQKDSGGKKKGKQKRMDIRVDCTPMVDMNMLLLTFFMLCTSMSKPQTMEISMPSNDKTLTEQERDKVAASRAITLILGSTDRVYYYSGEPNYEDWTSLQETTYKDDGLRAMLLYRNQEVVSKIRELKKEKIETKMSDEEYDKRAAEIKDSKTAPIVIIKATDDSTYKNLIDALDEMHICSINRYAIVDLAEGDECLVEQYEKKGEHPHTTDSEPKKQQ